MMAKLILAIVFFVTIGFSHNSYTGGYSSAPGRQTCASSCHGSTGGTLVVTGFPTSYQPLQIYSIVVKHNGGSRIVNFNATMRVGSSSTVAGAFTTVTNSVLYTGADGGVYASPHSIDSAVFQWTAPAAGTGPVNFYAAAFQGTTSSGNGQSSRVTISAAEITTSVVNQALLPNEFTLGQNYPNPFNPTTNLNYELPVGAHVSLKMYDVLGKEVASLVDGFVEAGDHYESLNAAQLSSGVYFYRLSVVPVARRDLVLKDGQAGDFVQTKKLLLLK
jgi:hypothetical protein